MTICLYTVVVSPHQLPLARAIVDKIGASEFRYIYTETQDADHACLNFKLANESWILHIDEPEARVWLRKSTRGRLSARRCFPRMKGLRDEGGS